MESPHFNTSSIRDKWHRWKSRSTSKRRHISSIATVRTRWKVVVWLYGMPLLSAKRPRPPGRWEDALWKTIRKTIQMADHSFWSNGWISSYFTKDQARIHQFGKKVPTGIFLGYELIVGGIWKGDILIADLEDLEKLDASDIYLRWINAKQVLIRQKDDEINILYCRGYSKIGRKRLRISRIHSKAGIYCKEWRSQWRTSRRIGRGSTGRTNRWRWSPVPTFGRSKVTSSIVITVNLEFNSMCRRKKHSLFHWNLLTSPVFSSWSGCHVWERQCEEAFVEHRSKKIPNWECMFVHLKQGLFLSVCVGDIKMAGKNQNLGCHVEKDDGRYETWMQTERNYCRRIMKNVRITNFCSSNAKSSRMAETEAWSYDMEGHAQKCVDPHCELANKKVEQLYTVSSPCLDDHHFKKERNLNQLEKCQNYAHKLSWNACTGHELDHPTSFGQSTSLRDQSQNGLRHVTDD